MFESGVFTEGRAAWHGLGTVVPDTALTSSEALRLSGLGGWELQKLPLFTRSNNGVIIEVPGQFAHVRQSDNQVLGVVGNVYRSVTNEQAFEWADALVGGYGAFYKTAGSLHGGKVVWLQMEVPFKVDLPDGKARHLLYLFNSHDGSSPVEAAYCTERIVCANTLAIARGQAVDRVRIKHTSTAEQRLAEAQRVMSLASGAAERAGQIAEELFKQKVTAKQLQAVIDAVFPLPVLPEGKSYDELETGQKRSLSIAENKRDAVLAAYNGEKYGAPEIRGTAWGVYNAFSAAYEHQDIGNTRRDPQQEIRKAEAIFDNIMNASTPADKALAVLRS
jgi:phage/plasmid-like protein (TIGR03299 family)